MLHKEIIQKVLDFVRIHPRTVQDIASLLQNNWRTADRYVEQIAQDVKCSLNGVLVPQRAVVIWYQMQQVGSTSCGKALNCLPFAVRQRCVIAGVCRAGLEEADTRICQGPRERRILKPCNVCTAWTYVYQCSIMYSQH